jgi:hypothetical protein
MARDVLNRRPESKESHMYRPLASFLLLALFSAWNVPSGIASSNAGSEQASEKKSPNQSKSKESASLTGCVDEQDGHYILIHDQTREKLASLVAEGFENEGFAKHVGHKVTVKGTSVPADSTGPIFRVRSIETVNETCAPQQVQ